MSTLNENKKRSLTNDLQRLLGANQEDDALIRGRNNESRAFADKNNVVRFQAENVLEKLVAECQLLPLPLPC